MKIKISFAIVTYNNESIITNTVKSIINSVPDKYEYVLYIIDNNSDDDTVNIVASLSGNIKIIELNTNKGFGYGHNQVINVIDSDYHFVVNPDIIIENSEQIEKMVEFMVSNKSVGMLSPLILNDDLTIQYLCKKNPTVFDMAIRRISPRLFKKRQDEYVMKKTGYDKIMSIDYASGSFMMFDYSVFKSLRGFDDKYFMYLEDADITRRTNQISKAVFYPYARVIHKWERSGHKKIKYAKITIDSMIIYFKKWGWKII